MQSSSEIGHAHQIWVQIVSSKLSASLENNESEQEVPIDFCITVDSSAAKRTIVMSAMSNENSEMSLTQANLEQITSVVSSEFRVQEGLMENGTPTYYLVQPQETKQAFLRVLKNLEPMNLIAVLRRETGRVVLKIVPKPPVKPSNVLINCVLFFCHHCDHVCNWLPAFP